MSCDPYSNVKSRQDDLFHSAPFSLVPAQAIFSYATVVGGYVRSISAPSISRTCLFWRKGRKLTFLNHKRARLDSEEDTNTTPR